MQQSSMVVFCDECGLANEPGSGSCVSCGQPLAQATLAPVQEPIAPVVITPQPVRAVTPGATFTSVSQGTGKRPLRFAPCSFQPGSLLAGRYRIEGEIGRGGFSTVYRAIDQQPGYYARMVAIKRIQLSKLTPRQIIDATETFNREVSMLMLFRNVSGIPAYYEHLTDAENWYLITQYIEGETLEARMQKAPGGFLGENEVVRLAIGLAELLHKLHTLNPPVVFRDLKPDNIMLAPDNSFFLIDFGIARQFRPEKSKDTTPLGSPGYAAPEQYGSAQSDPRTDIYGLGATLQTLLTGRDPLELRSGESPRNPVPISRRLRKLLDEMLTSRMDGRPVDMERVKKRLEYVLHRPVVIVMAGAIIGSFVGIMTFLSSLFIPLDWRFWTFVLVGPLAQGIRAFLERKWQIPTKGSKVFWLFWASGMAIGILPWLLLDLIFK